jgi:hypothetical protein
MIAIAYNTPLSLLYVLFYDDSNIEGRIVKCNMSIPCHLLISTSKDITNVIFFFVGVV